MSKLARAWTWIRENGTALLVVSGFVGGFWVAAGSLATKDDFERATRSLATRADLAPLASRADLATTERTVNTLRETVAGLATAVDGLNGAVDRVNATVDRLGENVERTNETVVALSATVEITSDTVNRLSETVERLGVTAEALDGTIPLLVSCVIDLHFWNLLHVEGRDEQQPLPESCEQARRQ